MRRLPLLALLIASSALAAPPESVGIGLGYPLAPGQLGGTVVVSLSALTFGAATYTTTSATGSTIETILGATGGSSLTISGSDVTNGYLALGSGGTTIVVGASPVTAAGTVLSNYALTETLAGATNSPRVTAGASITVTASATGGKLDFSDPNNSGLQAAL